MKKLTYTLILLVILAAFALLLTASARPSLSDLIQQYPTLYAGNAAGCSLNWDIEWMLYDPAGALIATFKHGWPAALALLVCD